MLGSIPESVGRIRSPGIGSARSVSIGSNRGGHGIVGLSDLGFRVQPLRVYRLGVKGLSFRGCRALKQGAVEFKFRKMAMPVIWV